MDERPESESEMLQRVLHISDVLANRLVAAGITTIEEVAWVPFQELRQIGGLWDEEATLLRNAARKHILDEVIGPEGDFQSGLTDA